MSLYPGLFCPTSFQEGRLLFTTACRSSSGSDQITSHAEALYPEKCGFPLHRIGDVTGLGVTTSDAIPYFVRSYVLSPFHPSIRVLLICPFLGLTYDPAGLFLFGAERFRARIGFSCGKFTKRNANKRFFNFFSFRIKTFWFTSAEHFARARSKCEFCSD